MLLRPTETTDVGTAIRNVGVLRAHGEYRVIAVVDVPVGGVVMTLDGVIEPRASQLSIQLDDLAHLEPPAGIDTATLMDRYPWRFLNHGCDPNVRIVDRTVLAVRPIAALEEVVFDYNTTEDELAVPFRCRCGSPSCTGAEVRGFRHLSLEEQRRRRPLLRASLRRRLDAGPEARGRADDRGQRS